MVIVHILWPKKNNYSDRTRPAQIDIYQRLP